MSTKHFCVVRQVCQLFEALHKGFVITAFQIGASAAATKEGVARKEDMVFFGMETNTTMAVSWCGEHFKGCFAKHHIAPIEQ